MLYSLPSCWVFELGTASFKMQLVTPPHLLIQVFCFRYCAGDAKLVKIKQDLLSCKIALTALQERGRLVVEASLIQVCTARSMYGTHYHNYAVIKSV